MTTPNSTMNNSSIRSILEKEKLNGNNFLDWYRNLRIVLKAEQKFYHLEEPLPEAPAANATAAVRNAHQRRSNEQQEVACLMLASMIPELQKNLENFSAFDMLRELKVMFEQQAEQELFDTVKSFHACKQEEGQSVSSYVMKMKSYLDQMERLGYPMPQILGVSMILTSLLKDYDQFVQNYNMHNMGKTIAELHNMLKLAEKGMPKKAPLVLAINQGRIQKKNKGKPQAPGKGQGKGKAKLAYAPKPKIPPPAKKEHPAKDTPCHHCGVVGHWRRNCHAYLEGLKKNKASVASTSGIFTIELYTFPNKTWVYDTGCGTHICNNVQGLRGSRKLKQGALHLYVGNGDRAAVEAIGSFDLILPNGLVIVLNNCHFAPTITRGVVSLSRLKDDGYIHTFTDFGISVSKDNVFYFNAIPRDGIFEIDMRDPISNNSSIYTVSNKKSKRNLDSTFLWHCRLCHINKKRITKLQHDGLLESINNVSFDKCTSCISGKMARKPFSHVGERATDLLGLIHTDVCGPFRTMSREGANYFITFTDDFSRYGYVYLIKHKHEAFETFKVFQSEVENQLGKTIKALRSDRGGEYMSQEFLDHLKRCGIVSQFTPPYTPQHNGVSERRNRTLQDMVRSMMSLTTLPMSFWGYALESAARILNMVPTKKVDKTPYEIWHGKVPNLSYLKVWGCEALVKRDTPNKLEPRAIKCIFVGYPKETMGYYFYYPTENKIFVARYAEFFENSLISQEASGSKVDFDELQSEDAQPSSNTSEHQNETEHENVEPLRDVAPIRRSERIPQAPERYGFYIDAEEHELGDHCEPANYREAISCPECEKWNEAMNVEMKSMGDNDAWVEVDIPPNAKTVGSKWLYKIKTDVDGNEHTYKARLVAKGFTQIYGIDYDETFSPVADIKAIRILIAIAAYYDYEIWQMDVKTAFLNGHLNEDVYMVQPEGFVNPKYPSRVCKLKRSIYGLKQASRSWNKRFDEEIKKIGFAQNPDEPCVYINTSGSIVAFLILYVDDILLIGNNIPMLQDVKSWLGKCFDMKDLGEASYILGVKIYRDRSKRLIGLCQSAYIEKILKRFRMQDSKRGSLPMQPNTELSKAQGPSTPAEVKRMKGIPYASAVGSIMYAVRCTRPDVAFSQNLTSRFQQNPGECHWTAVKNILKYLRNTKDMFLVYGGDVERELSVTCYTDASWETDRDDIKSQTGYVFVMNGGAVDWKSAKQSTLAMSSTEAEYIAASEAAMEAVWIRKFISGLGVVPSNERPMDMYCDNSGAIIIANEPGVLKGAKHFRRKVHYIREVIESGDIRLLKVHTDDNLADPFTKPMSCTKHVEHARNIGLRPANSLM